MSADKPEAYHVPVMPDEVIRLLNPHGGGGWLDNTVGGGAHAWLICQKLDPSAVFIGIDRDPLALEASRMTLRSAKCRVALHKAHFEDAADIVRCEGVELRGAFWDLGLSSSQIDRGAGFSFRDMTAYLDMRQDPEQELTAADVLNCTPEKDLADLIYQNSDERLSRRIAASIVRARPLETMEDLVRVVRWCLPRGYKHGDDVLRRTCQAIRMKVNAELEQLEQSLSDIAGLLQPGGRLVLLSYHSGEDRIVKQFMKRGKLAGILDILTPKPLRPLRDEFLVNPRAKAARLRAAERCA